LNDKKPRGRKKGCSSTYESSDRPCRTCRLAPLLYEKNWWQNRVLRRPSVGPTRRVVLWSCWWSARISPADGPEQAPFEVPPDDTNRTAIWSAIWCLHRHLANDRDAGWCKRVCGQRGGCMIAGVSSSHSLTFLACRLLCERRACRGWCLQVVRFLRIGRGPLSHRWTVGPLIALTRAPPAHPLSIVISLRRMDRSGTPPWPVVIAELWNDPTFLKKLLARMY